MRDYGKVSPRFWTGKTGKSLRGDQEAQLLALYLMTSPHANMIGVFHCPVMYMAHEIGMTIEGASKALLRLEEANFCTFDADEELVWVHEMAAHQVGEHLSPKDKQVIGIQRQFDQLPEGQIRRGFLDRYASDYHLSIPSNLDDEETSPFEAPSKPLRSQEQEQEQEVNPSNPDGLLVASQPATPDCPHQQIIETYHELLPSCPQVREWTAARQKLLRTRWTENAKRQSLAWWRKFFGYVAESEFLTGRGSCAPGRDPFVADLEWLVRPSNFVKVIEGRYHREAA